MASKKEVLRITLTRGIEVLREHEWLYKDDMKTVFCPTCGAHHRETTVTKKHKPNCEFVTILSSMEDLHSLHRTN